MSKELEFSLEYWRGRATFFESIINEMKGQREDLRNNVIERLENENAELKGILVTFAEAITSQLKHRTDGIIPKESEASYYLKGYRARVTKLDTLEFSKRCRNAFEHLGLKTLGDLCRRTESDLLELENFGETSLNEVKYMLRMYDLSLKSTPWED